MSDYCWRFGEHKGDRCPCGYDREKEENEILKRAIQIISDDETIDIGYRVKVTQSIKRFLT